MKDNQMKFKMTISKINVIKVGSVLSGKIEKGEITVGDKIEFGGVDGKQELEIKGITDNDTRKRIEKAGKGKNVGLLVVEKNCEQMGLQEGITVYIAEEETQEEYFSDLFGELEEEKIEEDKSNNKKNSENQAVIRVVVIYSDKICVDEETVRLRSHIENTKRELLSGESVGRKLDFIAQEMNREANTILSKSSDLAISDKAIALKTEIEKVREQIQNIE
mgnify:CR=1 FL=1